MNNTFALLIKINTGISLEDIMKLLPITFQSYEYMKGFLDGYLFNNYKLLTLKEYQNKENIRKQLTQCQLLDNYWLVFISLEPIEQDD